MAQRDWVLEHIQKYRESDGEEGHIWKGVDGKQNLPCLLLETTGGKTGEARTTALIYGQDGDRYVIVASRGGTPTHPLWYRTLVANPEVALQVGAERFAARAGDKVPAQSHMPRLVSQTRFPPFSALFTAIGALIHVE